MTNYSRISFDCIVMSMQLLKTKTSFSCTSIDTWFSSIDLIRDIFRNHHHIFVFDESTMLVRQMKFIIISAIYYIEVEKSFTTCLLFKYQWRHEMLAEVWRCERLFRLSKENLFHDDSLNQTSWVKDFFHFHK